MGAHYIGLIRVKDERAWTAYLAKVGKTISDHGGKVLFRGDRVAVLAGASNFERVVVLQFTDLASAQQWHDSADYQALVATRDAGAEVTLTLYQT
jgi:uncharacterized protein (DUF1330 family)